VDQCRPNITSLCSASYVSWQRSTGSICCWAPCCGAAAASDRISWTSGEQQQTRSSAVRRANNGTDGHPAVTQTLLHASRVNKWLVNNLLTVVNRALNITLRGMSLLTRSCFYTLGDEKIMRTSFTAIAITHGAQWDFNLLYFTFAINLPKALQMCVSSR